MNRSRTVWIVGLALGLSFIGLTSCSKSGEQSQAVQTPAEPAATAKDIWVSETTGKEYRVMVENDVLHIEWLNISPELSAHGSFIRTECKRQGAKWVGTSASYLPCTLGKGAKPNLDNWCHLETKIEIDSMTTDQIAGQGETLVKFDCLKCKILESKMKDFLWRPKK